MNDNSRYNTRFVKELRNGKTLARWFPSDRMRTKFVVPMEYQIIYGLAPIASETDLAKAGFRMFGQITN